MSFDCFDAYKVIPNKLLDYKVKISKTYAQY